MMPEAEESSLLPDDSVQRAFLGYSKTSLGPLKEEIVNGRGDDSALPSGSNDLDAFQSAGLRKAASMSVASGASPELQRATASFPKLRRSKFSGALQLNLDGASEFWEVARQTLARSISFPSLSSRPAKDARPWSARTPWRTESPPLSPSKVHSRHQALSMARCQRMLQELDRVTTEQLEEEMEDLLHYKNRYVKARLLHHAVFLSHKESDETASLVRKVLEASANVHGKASYRKDSKVNQLEAIHIAAGLGHVPSMRVLMERAQDGLALLNSYCVLDSENFYQPLHDAAYLGNKDAVVWLLENRADASPINRDGMTPLHWLAKKGLESEGDLEVMVWALLKHKARVDVKTTKEGKIPLELAAADDSGFPRRLLHLLAPSLTGGAGWEYSFFDDMGILSSLNMAAANQLARQLLESDDPGCHGRVRADAQKPNAVDRMASLFHKAPEAAADMLEILLVKPQVEDSGRHPIRSRASLWSLFYSMTMRCDYQSDVMKKDALRWPVWRYDSTKMDDELLTDQPRLSWHLSLVKAPGHREERREYVDDVDTKVVLIPNILDIDIFRALAFTRPNHMRIFAKLPVQGIIYCLWDNVMLKAVAVRLLFNGTDLLVQAFWGMQNADIDGHVEDTNSPVDAPASWAIVMAGLIRDLINRTWHFLSFYSKYHDHHLHFQAWQQEMKENAKSKSASPTNQFDADHTHSPPSLHALWRPQTFFSFGFLCWEVPMYLMKAWFLWGIYNHPLNGNRSMAMTDLHQALLTANTLMQFSKLIHVLRLTNCCKRVTTILSAFVSGAIREMFIVTFLFFGAVVLAFAMVKRGAASSSLGLYLYRGLLFGDGDALDYMGLNPKDRQGEYGVRTSLMLLATVLFNIVILNLTVAVYSSEYDRLEKESEVYLQRERAKTCCELLLSIQKIRLRGPEDVWILHLGKALFLVFAFAGACLLWPLTRPLGLRSFAAACLFALAQVIIQAINMASHWFPYRENGEEGPLKEHFLWICHRSSYNEEHFKADELNRETVQNIVTERADKLEEKMMTRISRLDDRVDALSSRMDGKIDGLSAQLYEAVQLLQAQKAVT